MFYDKLRDAVEQTGTKLTPFIKSLGLSTSNVTKWKSGSLPDTSILVRLCETLGVSADYFLEISPKSSHTETTESLSLEEKTIIKAYREQPDMQEAVKKLLGIKPEFADYRLVAKGGDNVSRLPKPKEPRIT